MNKTEYDFLKDLSDTFGRHECDLHFELCGTPISVKSYVERAIEIYDDSHKNIFQLHSKQN